MGIRFILKMPSSKSISSSTSFIASDASLHASIPPEAEVDSNSGTQRGGKKREKRPSATVVKSSLLVTPLPVDLRSLYARMIDRFFPDTPTNRLKHSHPPPPSPLLPTSEVGGSPEMEKGEVDPTAHSTATADDATDVMDPSTLAMEPTGDPLREERHDQNKSAASKGKGQAFSSSPSHSSLFSNLEVINNDGENALLLLEVDSKETAQKMFRRLHNARVCDRRWKVHYMPASALQCSREACLVECVLRPPSTAAMAEEVLQSIPGFLAIAKCIPAARTGTKRGPRFQEGGQEEPLQEEEGKRRKRKRNEVMHMEEEEPYVANEEEDGSATLVKSVLASFCDEGSALHARAVLSGRLVGSSGVRMFVKLRRSSPS